MSEGRIIVLATLPMLAGALWLAALRRPEVSVRYDEPVRPNAAKDGKRVQPQADGGYLGVIVAGYSAEVGTEVGGSVAEVSASVGTRVREGDPLLRVDLGSSGEDLRMARAKLEQQRASVARARAELGEASDLVRRLQSIESGVSDRAVVAARAKEQQAKAALSEAQAGLGVHEASIGQQLSRSKKHVIRAPFDGVVVARFVDPGALVVPGQVVARVITLDSFVRFAMPAADARAQRAGYRVSVEVPGARAVLVGVVSDVQPEVDAAAQMVFARARLDIPEDERALAIPGVRVRVRPLDGEQQRGGG